MSSRRAASDLIGAPKDPNPTIEAMAANQPAHATSPQAPPALVSMAVLYDVVFGDETWPSL